MIREAEREEEEQKIELSEITYSDSYDYNPHKKSWRRFRGQRGGYGPSTGRD
jgi:hypothetical protein